MDKSLPLESFVGLDAFNTKFTLATSLFCILAAFVYWRHTQHPLHRFPGPPLAAWSNVLHSYWFLGGRQPYNILALHEKYGPVVRTSPNELSFSSVESWKDIYGFRQGHRPFVKSPFYDGGSFASVAHSIVSERDPAVHGEMRKYLSHAFSDRSLKAQEDLVSEIVDLFVKQLGIYASGEEGADLVMWFNLTTFDIIGSLAFGESFGGLTSGKFHFWIKLVTNALRQGALADTMNRFPMVATILKTLMPGAIEKLVADTKTHEAHTIELIERSVIEVPLVECDESDELIGFARRVNNPTDRPDFLTRILEDRDIKQISNVQLAAHASDFVTAGSETTATSLSCISYYLLRTPRVFSILKKEIRDAFKEYKQINATSTANLKYLHAVALEGMRMYAPLPFALPRVVPPGGDTVDGHFLPADTIVSTNPVAASLSSANFDSPFEFRPERWLGENKTDQLEAAQPFSLGPRGCLGRNLAWIELNTVIAKLLFTYDLELLNKDLDWHRDSRMATLWQKPELRVRVTARAKGPQ